jgi:hypothetical protein
VKVWTGFTWVKIGFNGGFFLKTVMNLRVAHKRRISVQLNKIQLLKKTP